MTEGSIGGRRGPLEARANPVRPLCTPPAPCWVNSGKKSPQLTGCGARCGRPPPSLPSKVPRSAARLSCSSALIPLARVRWLRTRRREIWCPSRRPRQACCHRTRRIVPSLRSGLPFGGRFYLLAPEPDRLVEGAGIHRYENELPPRLFSHPTRYILRRCRPR